METNIAADITKDPLSGDVVTYLQQNSGPLGLGETSLYYNFPLYRDEEEGGLIATKILLISKSRGIFLVSTSTASDDNPRDLEEQSDQLEHVFSHVYARLLKNRRLRKSKSQLVVPLATAIFAPAISNEPNIDLEDTVLVVTDEELDKFIHTQTWNADDITYSELISTIEGAKGLIRPLKRDIDHLEDTSKGRLAALAEAEITTFDKRQRKGAIIPFNGPQRIRGLAGSGKTVVLAMKAALTHLREPNAKILYAFWTRSLYQHVRKLITRFYRQFDDNDPDWNKVAVMHGWGSASLPGVYYVAAKSVGRDVLTFQDASRHNSRAPFEFACSQLLDAPLKPIFDYVFLDEGQDYPMAFIKMCSRLAQSERFLIAYDELQNIFQTEAPSAAEIFGTKRDGKPKRVFESDQVLHKCYRNPREVLVCAHALGFGIYSSKIVQMLESAEHWEDIGYKVLKGDFTEGSPTVIERPEGNSLLSISRSQSMNEIVQSKTFSDANAELDWVIASITKDLKDGLRPEDILVIAIDDRNAKMYLNALSARMMSRRIRTHNVHTSIGEVDFQVEDCVTLATVHKAKGNEAFVVYVLGVDALFPRPGVRQRNMLFAAMTRAKGWLRVTGISPAADMFVSELESAKKHFPNLEFTYPDEEQMRVMRRDLEETDSKRLRIERMLEEVAGELSPDEISVLLEKVTSGKKSLGKAKANSRRRT